MSGKCKDCRNEFGDDYMCNQCDDHFSNFIPMSQPSVHEPDPLPGEKTVLDLVMQDLKDRALVGKEKYGTFLMTHNGRDALMDAYQEILDAAMYLRQLIEEKKNK